MKNKNIILVILFLCLAAAGGYAIGSYASAHTQGNAEKLSCPNVLADIIQSAKGDVYKIDDPNYVEPESHNLVTYSVKGDEIVDPVFDSVPVDLKDEQEDKALQKQAWQVFTTLVPSKDRQMVDEYMVFTDGDGETLAAVDQTEHDLTRWIVEVDEADLDNKDEFLFTLIHEYAHLLTLNDSQVSTDEEIYKDPYNSSLLESKALACPNYFTGGGCSQPNSYVNVFYKRFWVDINSEWKNIDQLQYADDLNPYYAGLYNFYLSHQDQFVDDYATTHPTEDIAESFAYFVFGPKPVGESIRDQKILFFYDFPELVAMRQQMIQNACLYTQQ